MGFWVKQNQIPSGTVAYFYMTTPPDGWLKCDGSKFDKSLYPDLFKVLGKDTTPDMRGLFIKNIDERRVFGETKSFTNLGDYQEGTGTWDNTPEGGFKGTYGVFNKENITFENAPSLYRSGYFMDPPFITNVNPLRLVSYVGTGNHRSFNVSTTEGFKKMIHANRAITEIVGKVIPNNITLLACIKT